jgi:hypothetical protein
VIDYIAAFMPDHSGKNFSPYVTIGVGTRAFLDALLAEPFTDFTFSPAPPQSISSAILARRATS